MRGELFEGIKQWEFERDDIKAKLPVFYYDNTTLTAIYTASTKKVKAHLPHPAMRPVELFPGRCLVAFTAFEYRETDIDPYNEFSITCLITFGRSQVPGLTVTGMLARRCFTGYVWHLPVTTEIARVGGVELYGYPKFLADIEFTKEGGWITCDLSEEGTRILSLKGRVLPTKKGKITRYITYPVKDGIPLKAHVYVTPLEFAESRNPKDAELTVGSGHAICDELGGIGLSKKPVVYQYLPVNEAILFGGRNLIDR